MNSVSSPRRCQSKVSNAGDPAARGVRRFLRRVVLCRRNSSAPDTARDASTTVTVPGNGPRAETTGPHVPGAIADNSRTAPLPAARSVPVRGVKTRLLWPGRTSKAKMPHRGSPFAQGGARTDQNRRWQARAFPTRSNGFRCARQTRALYCISAHSPSTVESNRDAAANARWSRGHCRSTGCGYPR